MKREREHDALIETKASPSRGTLRGLDWLNFLLADVQSGVGQILILYFFLPETRNARLENAGRA